jgi:hypothetical protein
MRRRYAIAHPLRVPLYYPYRWLRGVLGCSEEHTAPQASTADAARLEVIAGNR